MNAYNLDGIKAEIRKQIEDNKALLEAWEKVTFPTKKDGSPFKVMSKNISGASYFTESTALQAGECKLRVCASSSASGYISDEINAYELACYIKDDAKKAKPQNLQPKQQYLAQLYTYDLDDIKTAVSARIEYLKRCAAQLEAQADKAEAVYVAFRDAYGAALATLAKESGKAENSTLYHMVLDTVSRRYPYC